MIYISKIMKFVLSSLKFVLITIGSIIGIVFLPIGWATFIFMYSFPFLFLGYFLIAPFII